MTLIKSISGIRGTIGGKPGDNLTPVDVVECTAAFGAWLRSTDAPRKVVIGRDGRISGPMVQELVVQTLVAQGIEVIDLGLSTTPTVEMAVPHHSAGAGIIITASHNPKQWNALKFLNRDGEFISKEIGESLLERIANNDLDFNTVENLGSVSNDPQAIARHIQAILDYDLVDKEAVRQAGFKVAVDCINSTGALSIPPLLDALGVQYVLLNEEVTGHFAHNPEPLAKHLTSLASVVKSKQCDLGVAVDPDVDRLAFMQEDGVLFGEEYTLVAVADFILKYRKGTAVSNLSSTRALADVATKHGCQYYPSAVGEVNVVNKMKATEAVIGGEGNGGIIVPDFHYGRDALIGIALFLSHLAHQNISMSELKKKYTQYAMIKDKIQLDPDLDVEQLLENLQQRFQDERTTTIDGLKIDFEDGWVHLRKSNTEPILRLYAESYTEKEAQDYADLLKNEYDNLTS